MTEKERQAVTVYPDAIQNIDRVPASVFQLKRRRDRVPSLLDLGPEFQRELVCNGEAVAKAIETIHDENTSILSYNNENSLACVISLAYYYAKNDYIVHREYASGKGFADLVLIPRKHVDSPAIVVELKYGTPVDTAISQILQKNYPAKVTEYVGNLLLVGISYDPKQKRHSCVIKKYKRLFLLNNILFMRWRQEIQVTASTF